MLTGSLRFSQQHKLPPKHFLLSITFFSAPPLILREIYRSPSDGEMYLGRDFDEASTAVDVIGP